MMLVHHDSLVALRFSFGVHKICISGLVYITMCVMLIMIHIQSASSGDRIIKATLLNPDMCNPDFRLSRIDRKVPVLSYTYYSYMHNPDFA